MRKNLQGILFLVLFGLFAHSGQAQTITPTSRFVDQTYSAAMFTASAGTWTVEAGDVDHFSYKVDDDEMVVMFDIITSAVSATPGELRITLPRGKTAKKRTATIGTYSDNGGAMTSSLTILVNPGASYIVLSKAFTGSTWTASAGTTRVLGQITIRTN